MYRYQLVQIVLTDCHRWPEFLPAAVLTCAAEAVYEYRSTSSIVGRTKTSSGPSSAWCRTITTSGGSWKIRRPLVWVLRRHHALLYMDPNSMGFGNMYVSEVNIFPWCRHNSYFHIKGRSHLVMSPAIGLTTFKCSGAHLKLQQKNGVGANFLKVIAILETPWAIVCSSRNWQC